jgi:RNA polymerase-binding protein DksA
MNEPSPSSHVPPLPTETEIRDRAYQLYEQGGRVPGRDWENWLKAERTLIAKWQDASWAIPAEWQWHYRTLRQIRDTLQAERTEHAAAMRSPVTRSEAGSDSADIASDQSERALLLAELSLEDAELAEVEAALERIRNGTYGVCEVTGQPISAERLRAIPWTRRGIAAASHPQTPAAT